MTTYQTISDDPEVQAFYEKCRSEGTSHNLSVIFATRRCPGSVTDREVMRGAGTLADQFKGEEAVMHQLIGIAEKEGRKPHYTDRYVPQIANFPGDPAAFVPASDARGHIKKVCEQRNLDCDGLVKHKSDGRGNIVTKETSNVVD